MPSLFLSLVPGEIVEASATPDGLITMTRNPVFRALISRDWGYMDIPEQRTAMPRCLCSDHQRSWSLPIVSPRVPHYGAGLLICP